MTARLRTIHLAEPLGGLGLEEKNDIASMLGNQPWNSLLAPHALGEHCPFTPTIVSRLEGLRDSVKSSKQENNHENAFKSMVNAAEFWGTNGDLVKYSEVLTSSRMLHNLEQTRAHPL